MGAVRAARASRPSRALLILIAAPHGSLLDAHRERLRALYRHDWVVYAKTPLGGPAQQSVLQEAREVQLAIALIELGARLQFLEAEVSLSRVLTPDLLRLMRMPGNILMLYGIGILCSSSIPSWWSATRRWAASSSKPRGSNHRAIRWHM